MMGWEQLVSNLSWPVVAGALGFGFREQIRDFLSEVAEVRVPGLRLRRRRKALPEEVTNELASTSLSAEATPEALPAESPPEDNGVTVEHQQAIAEAWTAVVVAMRSKAAQTGVSLPGTVNPVALAGALARDVLNGDLFVETIEQLQTLADKAARAPRLTEKVVREFSKATRTAISVLTDPAFEPT
jgi:hypothetical protein